MQAPPRCPLCRVAAAAPGKCRQGEGLGAEGYSVQEACLLARSTLAQQRVLALRLLAAVLALSRPSVACSSSVRVPLPPAIAAELQQQAAAGLEWVAVWHHALHAADVVLLLRRSLDDAHPAVAAAAAQALAALLGAAGPAGAAEEAAAEGTDAAPLAGWPAPPLRHMQVWALAQRPGLAPNLVLAFHARPAPPPPLTLPVAALPPCQTAASHRQRGLGGSARRRGAVPAQRGCRG